MPVDINYDESGEPKTVVLSYEEYQRLTAKPDERAIVHETALKIGELIQAFVRNAENAGVNADVSTAEQPPEEDFAPAETPALPQALPVPPDVRHYRNATGYYDSYGFRVLKGSKAKALPSQTALRNSALRQTR